MRKRTHIASFKNAVHRSHYQNVAVFTPSQGFFNFLVYIRPKVIRYFAEKKKRRRDSAGSFSSNGIHVSGISAASSIEQNKRDVSIRSEDVKLMDPFMKSGDVAAEASENSTVKTRFDTSIDEAASDGKNEN